MTTARKIAEDLDEIRAALAGRQAPFISSLLARARVIASKAVERVGVDIKTNIYVNPDFWGKLNFLEKAYIGSHELFHAAGYHPLREKARVSEKSPADHKIFNYAADSVVFRMLQDLIRCPPVEEKAISPNWVSQRTGTPVERMSVEEVFDLLKKHVKVVEIGIAFDLIPGRGPEGEVVQEGDPVLREGIPDEIKEAWKDFVARAHAAQRAAGTVPAGLERFVEELTRPKLDPRSLIRYAIRTGLGKTIVSDWKRRSRRYPDTLPGIKRFTSPTIHNLVDGSGSITPDDLKLELGTVYEFSRLAKVVVVSFDTEAYRVVEGKKPSDVLTKIAKEIRGGGGTLVRKALETTLKRMKYKDAVLLLSDGHVFDLEEEPVRQLIAQVAQRASVCAFLTVDREPQIPQWRTIKLKAR